MLKCIHTTPLSELLLERGYTFDTNDRSGQKIAVFKDGKKIGRHTAEQAHKKFILNEIF